MELENDESLNENAHTITLLSAKNSFQSGNPHPPQSPPQLISVQSGNLEQPQSTSKPLHRQASLSVVQKWHTLKQEEKKRKEQVLERKQTARRMVQEILAARGGTADDEEWEGRGQRDSHSGKSFSSSPLSSKHKHSNESVTEDRILGQEGCEESTNGKRQRAWAVAQLMQKTKEGVGRTREKKGEGEGVEQEQVVQRQRALEIARWLEEGVKKGREDRKTDKKVQNSYNECSSSVSKKEKEPERIQFHEESDLIGDCPVLVAKPTLGSDAEAMSSPEIFGGIQDSTPVMKESLGAEEQSEGELVSPGSHAETAEEPTWIDGSGLDSAQGGYGRWGSREGSSESWDAERLEELQREVERAILEAEETMNKNGGKVGGKSEESEGEVGIDSPIKRFIELSKATGGESKAEKSKSNWQGSPMEGYLDGRDEEDEEEDLGLAELVNVIAASISSVFSGWGTKTRKSKEETSSKGPIPIVDF